MKKLNFQQLNTLVKFYDIPTFVVCFPNNELEANYRGLEELGLIYMIGSKNNGTAYIVHDFRVTELGREFVNEVLETSGSIIDNMNSKETELEVKVEVKEVKPELAPKPSKKPKRSKKKETIVVETEEEFKDITNKEDK